MPYDDLDMGNKRRKRIDSKKTIILPGLADFAGPRQELRIFNQ
jgi:hypothetical protein